MSAAPTATHTATTTTVASPLGELQLVPLTERAVPGWAPLLHAWVTHPRSRYWGMGTADLAAVEAEYARIAGDAHHDAWVALLEGRPVALVETYDAAHSPLAGRAPLQPGDAGLHLLVAPPREGEHLAGLTAAVMAAAVRLAQHRLCPSVAGAPPDAVGSRPPQAPRRVVVEPDAANTAVHRLNARAGFVPVGEIALPDKTALFSTLAAADHAASEIGRWMTGAAVPDPAPAAAPGPAAEAPSPAHLTPAAMADAQRHLCVKALRELSHERLVRPEPIGEHPSSGPVGSGPAWRLVTSEQPEIVYTWCARELPLEHHAVDAASLRRTVDGEEADLDAQALVTELRGPLGIPDHLLGTYLEEIAATLAGHAWKRTHHTRTSEDLLDADLATVEAAMTEGHPAFIANNGRIGFSLADHEAYAPEAGADVRLEWLAARRSASHLALAADLDEQTLWEGELGERRETFDARLRALGHDPGHYLYLPVHPWQWQHKHVITFAPDVARGDLVHLGPGDAYRAQQSIRTFLNVEQPQRRYVKTALAIQNMGFLRGLSPAYMRVTPAINDWVAGVVAGDDELAACGFTVLREVASVGYTGDAYHLARLTPAPAQQKMLAALWRESPVAFADAGQGESLRTMASLLHRDAGGRALASAMVTASGLDAADWVAAYLRAYLRPVAHCLLAHDLAFMPHGENVILVVRDHVVQRVVMKDIGEECAVLSDRPLPAEVERVRAVVPPAEAALAVFTDVYDGVLRYLAEVLDVDGLLPAERFWQLVHACLDEHRREHPGLHARVDLFAEQFAHSCLNRLQLRNTLQMVDLTDQSASLLYAGQMVNPASDARWAHG